VAELIGYERKNQIAYITLRRPHKLNALTDEMTIRLRDALGRFDQDTEAWVAILRGEGRAFCVGADVANRQARPREELERLGGTSGHNAVIQHLFHRFVNYKPVIGAVHGYAIGGGFSIALQCDLVVASEDAKFQITEVGRGLNGLHHLALMRERGAYTFGLEAALTSRYFGAGEALRNGVINRVAPVGSHVEEGEALADMILENPPLAVRALVRTRRIWMQRTEGETESLEDRHLHLSKDFHEAVSAFIEKRQATFRGE
jgi:enoyl-CoA hydratase/carnithine racemase